MLKTSLAGLTILLLATTAHAEQGTAPPVTPVPLATAPAPVDATPPPVDAGRVQPVFMDQVLSFDEGAGVAVQGRARRPLSHEELYLALDRPDLAEKSRDAMRRRVILGVAGGVVLVAGVITAVVAKLNLPNLNSSFCTAITGGIPLNYNTVCVPETQRLEVTSATGLIAGVGLGGLLLSLAYVSNPDVLSKNETSTLISRHNGSLLQRLRSERSEVRVAPYASARGAGLTTVVAF